MSNYRPQFHITAPQGRLNDPNGMFLDGDTLHVFYQHDPAFPNGLKRTGWGHASTSLEQLEWVHHPDALYPDFPYDLHGCYSGGAVQADEKTYLFYTGNLKVGEKRIPSQNLVHCEDPGGLMGGVYRREARNPLIPCEEEGYTGHFRDPMIQREESGWRMVLGAQRSDETPAVVVYRSDDLLDWQFCGELQFDLDGAEPGNSPDLIPGGYMWECPNLLRMFDHARGEEFDVLVICPQGLEAQTDSNGFNHYASSDQCGYIVGKLDGTSFRVVRGFTEIDYGQQFYAPQLVSYWPDAIMVGWMGLPAQDDCPSLGEGWVHALTTPRMLCLENLELHTGLMIPAQLREQLGDLIQTEYARVGNALLLSDYVDNCACTVVLEDEHGVRCATIHYEPGDQPWVEVEITGDSRRIGCRAGQLLCYVDGSYLEVTIGGTRAFSAAVFPSANVGWGTLKKVCE